MEKNEIPGRNIFSEGAQGEQPVADPCFATQADAQAGGPPSAPLTNNPFPPQPHLAVRSELETFFEGAGPTTATRPAIYSQGPTVHLPLRPDFEQLARRSAPASPLKR